MSELMQKLTLFCNSLIMFYRLKKQRNLLNGMVSDMINEEYVLKCIEPYLNKKREISEFEFYELFSDLTIKEQYSIIDIFIKNDIDYVDEKETETEKIKQIKAINMDEYGDYKKLLSLSNEHLCVMAQKDDKLAVAALIKKNERFLYKVAIKIKSDYRQKSFDVEDLFQFGAIGLIESIKNFDISKEYTFLTYSWYKIRQCMVRAIVNYGYMIRIPSHLFDKVIRINKYRSNFFEEMEDDLINTIIESEYKLGRIISKNEIREYFFLADNILNTSSLNTFVSAEQDDELINFIPNEEQESVEDLIIKSDLEKRINDALQTLSKKEQEVIRLRFGFNEGKEMTLEEVGKRFNVTRERIRQIEAKAIRKLAHPVRSKYIKSFYEV